MDEKPTVVALDLVGRCERGQVAQGVPNDPAAVVRRWRRLAGFMPAETYWTVERARRRGNPETESA